MSSLCRFATRSVLASVLRRSPLVSVSRFRPLELSKVSGRVSQFSTSSKCLAGNSEEDMTEFLVEEIKAEKGNQKPLPQLEGFQVKADGAELTFTKEANGEKIEVSLNVNHTVDSAEPDDGTSQEAPEMRSKPNFEIDIIKGGKTLSFSCSYIYEKELENQEDSYDDVFAIDEVTMFEGEWKEKRYAVAGDILDGYLYDLFMNMLDERGINADFANKISDYCSSYEHSQYIGLLENLQKFVRK